MFQIVINIFVEFYSFLNNNIEHFILTIRPLVELTNSIVRSTFVSISKNQ